MAPRAIAVFGSSEPLAGEPAYEQARELGRRLASAGFAVITGGYGGVMEAASRGAREGGGTAIGVPSRLFSDRKPNRWVDSAVMTEDLYERSRELIERAGGYVILPGRAGTLSELALLWALIRAGCLERRPVILLGDYWKPLFDQLSRSNVLEPAQQLQTRVVATSAEALERIAAALGPQVA